MTYHVVLRSEVGEGLNGSIMFYNDEGEALGEQGIHVYGTDIYDSDIPAGTTHYRFIATGYNWYGTSILYDNNTITLVKEVPVLRYLLFGGIGIAAGYFIIKFLKF